jgi:hypothetical protein
LLEFENKLIFQPPWEEVKAHPHYSKNDRCILFDQYEIQKIQKYILELLEEYSCCPFTSFVKTIEFMGSVAIFGFCYPLTIRRFIASVMVNSVYC